MNNKTRFMLKSFFSLLLIISLQSLMMFIVNLVDNFMLGTYSETAMAGAALVNQIQFIVQMIVGGIGVGITVLGAQYWGKNETAPIRKIISIGMKLAFIIGLLFTLLTLFIPGQIMTLFTNDAPIHAEAVEYLSIMCFTYIIYALSATLMFSLRSVETALIGMVMSAITIVINAFLNYTFIYGNFGAPELGIKGAAYATLTSRLVELLVILIYVLFIDKKLRLKLRDIVLIDLTYIKDYVKISLPVVFSGATWGIAQSVQTMILGHISAETIAANSVAVVIFQIFGVVGLSCTNASTVIIGKAVGQGDSLELIKRYTRILQLIFIAIGVVSGVLLIVLRGSILSLYALSPATHDLADQFLLILGITIMGSIYEYPVQSGIISGGGDPKYQVIVDNVLMWAYSIPLSALCAFVFQVPPVVTFFVLKSDQLIKCVPNAIKCNRFKWVKNLTR